MVTWLAARPLTLLRMTSYYGGVSANDLGMSAADGEGAAHTARRSVGSQPHAAFVWGDRPLDSLLAGPSVILTDVPSCHSCPALSGPVRRVDQSASA